eukprot:gene4724-4563_t
MGEIPMAASQGQRAIRRIHLAESPMALAQHWNLLRLHPPPAPSRSTKKFAPEGYISKPLFAPAPPMPEQVWAPSDRAFRKSGQTSDFDSFGVMTLNIYHYSRIIDAGTFNMDVKSEFAEMLITKGVSVFCLQDTKLPGGKQSIVRNAFQQIDFVVFFTEDKSSFQCIT